MRIHDKKEVYRNGDVYKFKVKLKGLERIVWREIDISSLSRVAKLG